MTVLPLPHSDRFSATSPSLAEAVPLFLDGRDLAASSRRVYGQHFARLIADLGADTPIGSVSGEQLRAHLAGTYATAAPRSWNHAVALLSSLWSYAARQGWATTAPAAALDRKRERLGRDVDDKTRAIPAEQLRAFLVRSHPLRDKTLWCLLYESAARASEALGMDIPDLDLGRRQGRIIGKGGNAERIAWETSTARLLPRLIAGRKRGPLFLADKAPASARQPAAADLDPDTGRARLSYRRAAECFTAASGGWTLHQLRHSRLTHLAEGGLDVTLLRTISRHTSLRTLEGYARPSLDAAAAAAARLDPARRSPA
jgi:integrase/recombinase XerC/integrase/recombinase XerD